LESSLANKGSTKSLALSCANHDSGIESKPKYNPAIPPATQAVVSVSRPNAMAVLMTS